MEPTFALAEAAAQTRAAEVVAELGVAAATAATSAPVEGAAEAELGVAAVGVAKSAPAAVAVVAQEVAAAPVVKCPRCSRLLVVLLDQYFAAVRQLLDNFR
jgi:hypothetical protein